jgi:aminobenzoyl-glutamate transport protein
MAHFGMIVIFVRRCQKDAGVGTVVTTMPYFAVISAVWTVFLIGWYPLGVPFGS